MRWWKAANPPRHRRGGVALYQQQVRLPFSQHRVEPCEHARADRRWCLARRHHFEVVVDTKPEVFNKGVEEVRVLCRGDVDRLETVGTTLQLPYDRRKLDDLRSGAEDGYYFYAACR